jgi:hypothetical protein
MLENVVDFEMIRTREENGCLDYNMPTIYIETITYLLAFTDRIEMYHVNSTTLCNVLSQYPYLLFNVMYKHTIPEQQRFVKSIMKNINNLTFSNPELDKYLGILQNYWKGRAKYKHVTNYFNNFHGIKFDKVNISYDELPKGKLFSINIGHNYNETTYLYTTPNSIKDEFATVNNVINSTTHIETKLLHRQHKYEFINNGGISNDYFICLNYCNHTDNKRCRFTVCTSRILKQRDVDVITGGGIIEKYPNETLAMYIAKQFHDRIKLKYISDAYIMHGTMSLINRCYNPDLNKCIANWRNIMAKDCMLETFLKSLKMFSTDGILNKEKYIEAMLAYYDLD